MKEKRRKETKTVLRTMDIEYNNRSTISNIVLDILCTNFFLHGYANTFCALLVILVYIHRKAFDLTSYVTFLLNCVWAEERIICTQSTVTDLFVNKTENSELVNIDAVHIRAIFTKQVTPELCPSLHILVDFSLRLTKFYDMPIYCIPVDIRNGLPLQFCYHYIFVHTTRTILNLRSI